MGPSQSIKYIKANQKLPREERLLQDCHIEITTEFQADTLLYECRFHTETEPAGKWK